MNEQISTCHLVDTSHSSGPDCFKQTRHMLTLLMETERAIHYNPDAAAAYLNQAIALLAADSQSEPRQRKTTGGLALWQVTRINEFIKQRLDQCIRTTELASLLGLSVSHFSHAFKQTLGMTPKEYIAARRVEAAGQYMLSSEHSLSDIALSHGFCDQSHFCRVFRRETGLSPQVWRKLHASTPHTPSDGNAIPSQGSGRGQIAELCS